MGLFSKILGSKLLGGGIDKTALIKRLVRLRCRNDPMAEVMGIDDEMIDSFSTFQLMGLPEATIVTIVEMWAIRHKQSIPDSAIFSIIEKLRSHMYPSGQLLPSPLNLTNYIKYRLSIELPSSAYPIDEPWIDAAVEVAKKTYLGLQASTASVDINTLEQPRTMLDEVQEVGEKLIVSGYRRLAAQHECAPTAKTSDQQIINIYKEAGTAFRKVADQRGEHLPAGTINYIVWKFLQVSEMLGNEMVDEHLTYELQKYLQEGLRPDYQQDLKLF